MSTFAIHRDGIRAVMAISGEVTIQNISEFKESLLRLQEESDELAIDLEGIQEADVACLQMICCAHRTWLQMNKRLTIAGAVPEGFSRILADSGFQRSGGCKLYSNHPCLWARRGDA